MAHEIEATDGLVLHQNRAWHGLGTIVEQAPTPREALGIAGLDWEVEQWALSATDGTNRVAVPSHVANIRKDTGRQLGIVGANWTPFQNSELADFCESLADFGDVKIETAGSIRGGEKVWFLLKGEQFAVRGTGDQDTIFPYILVSNGFDGGTSLRCTPTTVRVVCSNTLHLVIPRQESGTGSVPGQTAAYICRHTAKLAGRVDEARQALRMYGNTLAANRSMIDELAARDVTSDSVKRFFLEAFAKQFGAVADSPTTKPEKKHREAAMDCVRRCVETFEREESLAGANAWNAMNGYTNWLQHGQKVRRKDAAAAAESRLASNLFGVNADRTHDAFRLAFTLAG